MQMLKNIYCTMCNIVKNKYKDTLPKHIIHGFVTKELV